MRLDPVSAASIAPQGPLVPRAAPAADGHVPGNGDGPASEETGPPRAATADYCGLVTETVIEPPVFCVVTVTVTP